MVIFVKENTLMVPSSSSSSLPLPSLRLWAVWLAKKCDQENHYGVRAHSWVRNYRLPVSSFSVSRSLFALMMNAKMDVAHWRRWPEIKPLRGTPCCELIFIFTRKDVWSSCFSVDRRELDSEEEFQWFFFSAEKIPFQTNHNLFQWEFRNGKLYRRIRRCLVSVHFIFLIIRHKLFAFNFVSFEVPRILYCVFAHKSSENIIPLIIGPRSMVLCT